MVMLLVAASLIGVVFVLAFVARAVVHIGQRLAASRSLEANEILPLSTGIDIMPHQSAQITARPQHGDFTPLRMMIPAPWRRFDKAAAKDERSPIQLVQ